MPLRLSAQAGPSFIHARARSNYDACNHLRQEFKTSRSTGTFSTSAHCSQHPEPKLGKDKIRGDTHYETLGIHLGASRMEIKAAYFRLSKRYHPDVRRSSLESGSANEESVENVVAREAADKRATERFHEVNLAYKVLSDDRQRRAYDRTISSSSSTTSPHLHRNRGHVHAHTPGSSHSQSYVYEMHRGRKRGATHAWDSGPRGYTGWKHSHTQHTHPFTSTGGGRHYDPASFSSPSSTSTATGAQSAGTTGVETGSRPFDRILTGRALRAEEERLEHDRIVSESNMTRFFRALGIMLIITWVGSLASH